MYNPILLTDPTGNVPCGNDGSTNECARQSHIQMRDYPKRIEYYFKEVFIFGPILHPDYFGFDTVVKNPLSFSIFVETGIEKGFGSWDFGLELFFAKDHEIGLYSYYGEGNSIGLGGSIEVGLEISVAEMIHEHIGDDWDVYISLSKGAAGVTLGFSNDSLSFAWAPGLQVGFGWSFINRLLIENFTGQKGGTK
jgi:hypothetical protein